MVIYIDYLPFMALLGLIITLLAFPRAGLAKPAVIAALLALAASPGHISDILGKVGPSLIGVLVMMTAVQLAVAMALDERGGDWLGAVIARPLHVSWLAGVPASVLVPCILMPLAMACAAAIHNIPAVALLAPLAFSLCQRLGIPWVPSLVGLIPASNLGGASAAWGDTPAILQRQVWGFDVSTFAANMLPRNLLVLCVLMVVVGAWSFWTNQHNSRRRVMETFERIRIRDQQHARSAHRVSPSTDQYLGGLGLVSLFAVQILQPVYALAGSMAILALLLACRASSDFVRSTFVLGDEAVLAIAALFTISAVIEHSPLLAVLVEKSLTNHSGSIEVVAFLVTSLISADGAATMLASVVHAKHDGSLDAAWSLASGICAGSTALLTSASAGPILIEAAKKSGVSLSFRTYAVFGVPFSLLMLTGYLSLSMAKLA
ncbi:MAG: SLC13 family permease [Pseudomonadota bacterium]